MDNIITIQKITKSKNKISVDFKVGESLKQYFLLNNLFLEYEEDVSSVDNSIAIIPFIANVLPILWLTNSKIEVDSIDESFFNCVKDLKIGYENMYPMYKFADDVIVAKEVKKNVSHRNKNMCMFSGGVDAFDTLIRHCNEDLELFTILGSDIPLSDIEGINTLTKNIKETAKTFEKQAFFCKTNFREILNYHTLNDLVIDSGDGYWHGFHHGIGLLSLASVLAYLHNVKTIYIASSYSNKERKELGHITCASDITIDPFFSVAQMNVVHDSVESDRTIKLENICNWVNLTNKKINIHVCWKTTDGNNCSNCEKCFRTLIAVCAIGKLNPNQIGFNVSKQTFKSFKKEIKYSNKLMSKGILSHYYPIQELINENSLYYKEIKWFKKYNLDNYYNTFTRRCYRFLRAIYRKLFKRKSS